MRLLRCIHSVNPSGGGPVEGIKQMSRVLASLGHSTEVISLDLPSDSWVRDFPMVLQPLGVRRSGYGYSPKWVPWLKENAGRFDAVIVSGLWQYPSFGTWRALAGSAIPYFVFPHGMLDPWFKRTYPMKHFKKWLYWPWGDYRVLRDAQAVFFTSEEERLASRESFWLYRCREKVVGYGTNDPQRPEQAALDAWDHSNPAFCGKRVWLFLSRLHPKKGVDLLIKAFQRVSKTDASIHLVLAGDGDPDYIQALQELARSEGVSAKISWVGRVEGVRKAALFRRSELFVLPSHQENFSIATVEALSYGVPVAISNKINIWREIEADRAGIVGADVLPGILDGLEKWQHFSLEDRKAFARRARESFLKRFDLKIVATGFADLLRQLGVRDSAVQ